MRRARVTASGKAPVPPPWRKPFAHCTLTLSTRLAWISKLKSVTQNVNVHRIAVVSREWVAAMRLPWPGNNRAGAPEPRTGKRPRRRKSTTGRSATLLCCRRRSPCALRNLKLMDRLHFLAAMVWQHPAKMPMAHPRVGLFAYAVEQLAERIGGVTIAPVRLTCTWFRERRRLVLVDASVAALDRPQWVEPSLASDTPDVRVFRRRYCRTTILVPVHTTTVNGRRSNPFPSFACWAAR